MGSGTQNDPYIISSWSELMLHNQSDVYVKFTDDAVLDFLRIFSGGITEEVQILCNIDGNGCKWRNMCFKESGYISIYGEINSLKIQNFYYLSDNPCCFALDNNLSDMEFTGVVFAIDECGLFGSITNTAKINISTFNVMLGGKKCALCADSNINLTYSHINIVGNTSQAVGIFKSDTATASASNCWFSGRLQSHGTDSNYRVFSNNAASEYNFYNLDVAYTVSDNVDQLTNISVYNNEKITASTSSVFIGGCTSEQLNDKTYLGSLGFPVGA